MNEESLKEKMQKVASSLAEQDGLRLFALNWIKDDGKWDILVSADWIDYDRLRDNIHEILRATKREFNGQFAVTFSGIHPLRPDEPFVRSILEAFSDVSSPVEVSKYMFGSVLVDRMIIFSVDTEAQANSEKVGE